ncbi:hypothetical protein P154DRAFT_581779, partial [Amniculicola lignicola CBS 123094]
AHAHIATLYYISTSPATLAALTLSLRHFSRSLELNKSYLRGFYGLKLAAQKLLPLLSSAAPSTAAAKRQAAADEEDTSPPKLETVKKLEELATTKLGEIVRNYASGKKGWTGYDEAEVIAARELLDREGKVER